MKMDETNMRKAFHERLKTLMFVHNYTQKQLSLKLDISQSNLSHTLNDRYSPSTTLLVKLSEVFDVSIDWLLGRDEYMNKVPKERVSEIEGWRFML